ncbi:hypothetical protein ACRAWG_35175 [Methylobacterium sp. P31]
MRLLEASDWLSSRHARSGGPAGIFRSLLLDSFQPLLLLDRLGPLLFLDPRLSQILRRNILTQLLFVPLLSLTFGVRGLALALRPEVFLVAAFQISLNQPVFVDNALLALIVASSLFPLLLKAPLITLIFEALLDAAHLTLIEG